MAMKEEERHRTGSVSTGESAAPVIRQLLFDDDFMQWADELWRGRHHRTPLLVRSSSDSALSPQPTESGPPFHEEAVGTVVEVKWQSGESRDVVPLWDGSDVQLELVRLFPLVSRGLNRKSFCVFSPQAAGSAVERQAGVDRPQGKHTSTGRSLGLYIRGVEEESRSRKEGLFQEDECIVMINNTDLMDTTFSQAQEVFRQAMRSPVVRLEVVPSVHRERYEKSLIGQLFGPDGSPQVAKTKEPPPPVKAKPAFRTPEHPALRLAEEAASTEAAVNTPKGRSESPLPRKSPALSSLVTNKRVGRRLRIDLKKGSEGLGFTVVTRDSSVHGPGPILVKNILARGAAVKDGRLQSGDRILEVNGVDITGVGQEELVCMLRSTRQGDSVCLVVQRQEEMFLPREMRIGRSSDAAAKEERSQCALETR
ncbi:Partitioning defective 3 B [Liparis tanakae]|uniref:Partitioning defective 3 B n=1 Tax=Liparis tanakae TaxID=230148 RepID=A0A4Z2JEX6_9TELE|nr:Partitioning defective 3 B [Liparis tanakae]